MLRLKTGTREKEVISIFKKIAKKKARTMEINLLGSFAEIKTSGTYKTEFAFDAQLQAHTLTLTKDASGEDSKITFPANTLIHTKNHYTKGDIINAQFEIRDLNGFYQGTLSLFWNWRK